MRTRGWAGLTTDQAAELDAALWLPHRRAMTSADAASTVADEYAMRCATLLNGNELRGAMRAAEIAVAALTVARRDAKPPRLAG